MRSVNGLVILLSLTTAVFAYTVAIRAPWFGQLTDCSHEWCTATSLIWAQNWYREGALQSGFLLLENPASPEFTTLDSRSPYVSYPPGSILPLHVLSLLRGREPDLPLIMGVSLAGHWLVAASLAAAVYWLLLKCGLPMWNALLGAVPAPLIELLSPSPLYCHQNFYAMDSLAVVLFAICLALETARWTFPRWSTLADALLWVMLLLGYLTDWLFALVGPTLLVCRLVLEWRDRTNWRQRMLGTIVYWSSAMLAAGLFIGQLTILGRWHSLYDRFLERTGLTTARNSYGFAEFLYKFFWEEYVPGGYGAGTAWLLLAAISAFFSLGGWAVLKVRRGERLPPGAAELLAFQAAIVVSCLAHLLVLWQHSGHGFSVLKFSLLLATLPFSLLPVAALLLRDATPLAAGQAAAGQAAAGQARGWEIRWGAIQGAAAAICLAFLAWNSPRQLSLFGQPYLEPERLKMAFAAAGVEQRDVLVSPDMEIPARPPLALSETMKRVHRAASAGELAKVLAPVRPPFRISTLWAVEGQLRFRFWNVDSTDELAAAQAAAAADLISGESQTGSPPLYLSMDPAVPPSAEALARSLLALREPARAASVLADALTANPKSADLYCLHGIALFQAGRIEPAERQFLRAIELQPQSAEAHFSLGFLRQSERPAQAKADFAEALRIEPGLVEARCGLAAILLAEGALIDAAEQLRLALATNPRHAGALQLRQKLDALTRPSSSR